MRFILHWHLVIFHWLRSAAAVGKIAAMMTSYGAFVHHHPPYCELEWLPVFFGRMYNMDAAQRTAAHSQRQCLFIYLTKLCVHFTASSRFFWSNEFLLSDKMNCISSVVVHILLFRLRFVHFQIFEPTWSAYISTNDENIRMDSNYLEWVSVTRYIWIGDDATWVRLHCNEWNYKFQTLSWKCHGKCDKRSTTSMFCSALLWHIQRDKTKNQFYFSSSILESKRNAEKIHWKV